MVAIDFLEPFAASNSRLRCVDNYADVTMIVTVRGIPRLVSASDKLRDQYCHPTKRKLSGIKKMHCIAIVTQRDISALRVVLRLPRSLTECAVYQTVRNVRNPMTNIWIKRNFAVLLFCVELLWGRSTLVISPLVFRRVVFFTTLKHSTKFIGNRRWSLGVREIRVRERVELVPNQGLGCC